MNVGLLPIIVILLLNIIERNYDQLKKKIQDHRYNRLTAIKKMVSQGYGFFKV